MNVLLRSDNNPDVGVEQTPWEFCTLEKLDQHIRTLQVARAWLIAERRRRQPKQEPKP